MAQPPGLLYIPRSRLVWMDCPDTAVTATNLAAELQWHHEDHYVIWNVGGSSEQTYDPSIFGGRVINLAFSGHLCPPLLMLIEVCASIKAWLGADDKNVVAVHCRSGRGRSAVVLSCALAALSVQAESRELSSPVDWLSHICQLRGEEECLLTLPTHRRYLQYFSDVLLGNIPEDTSVDGCECRRIVLHGFPAFKSPPCVQLTSGNRTFFVSTDAQSLDDSAPGDESVELKSYSYHTGSNSTCKLPVVRGDVVLTVRDGSRSGPLLCRAGFYVDFAAVAGVLRLPSAALDGAASRLPRDAFVDIMLAPRAGHERGAALSNAAKALYSAGTRVAQKHGQLQYAIGDNDDGDSAERFQTARGIARNPVTEANRSFSTHHAPSTAPLQAPQSNSNEMLDFGTSNSRGNQLPNVLSPKELLSRYASAPAIEAPHADRSDLEFAQSAQSNLVAMSSGACNDTSSIEGVDGNALNSSLAQRGSSVQPIACTAAQGAMVQPVPSEVCHLSDTPRASKLSENENEMQEDSKEPSLTYVPALPASAPNAVMTNNRCNLDEEEQLMAIANIDIDAEDAVDSSLPSQPEHDLDAEFEALVG